MRELLHASPAVVLSSHKSYLDGGALTVGFHDHGLPPLTVFGGINMSFWPLGSLWRRANMVFIRRGGDDAVYRCTLRHYLAYLVSQRRPLQWFLEGTRSRTGKLGPPRLGLLVYIADAYRDGRIEDLQLVPVAVSYDQLQEVTEYAGEARGAAKSAESLGWLVRFVRAQRGRFGAVYVRFGEPVSTRASLGSPEEARASSPEAYRLALQKLAFEVSRRINDAIPISGSSLVTLALLGARGHALTLQQIRAAIPGYLDFARRRGLPMTPTSALDSDAAVVGVLDGLIAQGVARSHVDRRAGGIRHRSGAAPRGCLLSQHDRAPLPVELHRRTGAPRRRGAGAGGPRGRVRIRGACDSRPAQVRLLLRRSRAVHGGRRVGGLDACARLARTAGSRPDRSRGPSRDRADALLGHDASLVLRGLRGRGRRDGVGRREPPVRGERAARPVHGTRPAVPAAGPAAQPRGGLTPPVSCWNRARPQSRTLVAGRKASTTVAASSRQASRRCSAA